MMDIKLINIRQQTTLGANNQRVTEFTGVFNVGTLGPFMATVAESATWEQELRAKMDEVASKVRGLAGHE